MSLYTWKKEFCPVSAKSLSKKSNLAKVNRDLKKWEGLTKRNLKKHHLHQEHKEIYDLKGGVFTIAADTCALCVSRGTYSCNQCPLLIVRNKVRCDNTTSREMASPYSHFIHRQNPHPMIKWLRRAKKMLEEAR